MKRGSRSVLKEICEMTKDTEKFIEMYEKYLQRLGVPAPRRKKT